MFYLSLILSDFKSEPGLNEQSCKRRAVKTSMFGSTDRICFILILSLKICIQNWKFISGTLVIFQILNQSLNTCLFSSQNQYENTTYLRCTYIKIIEQKIDFFFFPLDTCLCPKSPDSKIEQFVHVCTIQSFMLSKKCPCSVLIFFGLLLLIVFRK